MYKRNVPEMSGISVTCLIQVRVKWDILRKKSKNYGNKLPVEKEKYKIRETKKRYNPLRKNKKRGG